MSRSHPRFPILQLAALLAFSSAAFSQATFPTATLTGIHPLGGQPGGTVELTLRGTDLDAPAAVLLGGRSLPVKSQKPNVVTLVLPADLKPALYDLRFVGRYGVSNPRVFEVAVLPETASPGTNTKAEKAHPVVMNSAVQGVFKSAEPHWFVFEASKGQPITAVFDGRVFDTRTELLGAVLDMRGREIARMRGGLLSFSAPENGPYRLRLNELMFRAGDDYSYRLTLAELESRTLPVADVERQTLSIPATVRGVFPPEGAARVFDLPFKAGDRFVIEVHSHQLGHPTDPHLVIENLKPDGTTTPQAEAADAPAITPAPSLVMLNRDPSYAYEAKADGAFRITLNDAFATPRPFELRVVGAAERRQNLIALNATLPKAATVRSLEVGTANVCRGGILALEVIAPNRNALSGPLELAAGKLPPGLTCLGGFIGKGQSLGYIAFQAATDAPPGAALLESISESVHVSYPLGDKTRENLLTRKAGPPAIGIAALSSPALIQTESGGVFEAPADGKLDIPLKITRHAEFADALKLKVHGLIDIAKAPETDIPAKAAAGKLTLDLNALKLPPGEYGFILQGPAKMKVRKNLEDLSQAETDAKAALGGHKDAQQKLAAANADTTPQKAELVKAATAALKAAEAAKAAADKRVKDLTAASAPKDATFIVCSNPVRLKVLPAAKK